MSMILSGNKNKGFLLIEVVVATAVIAIAIGGLITAAFFSLRLSSSVKQSAIANNLAQETLEALRNFKDGSDWNVSGLGNFTVGSGNPWHIEKSSTSPFSWVMVSGEEIVSGSFARKIILENVSRNAATGRIESVYNSADNDQETKKATVVVSWDGGKQVQLTTYFTNWK